MSTRAFRIREAKPKDVATIVELFSDEVHAGRMLPRDPNKIRDNLHLWLVAVDEQHVVGCVSLVFFNPDLCEVRSLAVSAAYRGKGLGGELIAKSVDLARQKKARRILTLTRATKIFEQKGFYREKVLNFPEKVWRDCDPCPFLHNCDEIALVYKI